MSTETVHTQNPSAATAGARIQRFSDYKSRLSHAERAVAKLEAKIRRLREAGRNYKAAQFERLLLRSHSLAIVAADTAAKKLNRKQRRNLRRSGTRDDVLQPGPTKADVRRTADRVNLWAASQEEVRETMLPKATGWRHIYSFGLDHRTRQEMVRRVIAARGDLHDAQRSARGGGLEGVSRDVCEALRSGYNYAVLLDIQNFYPSIGREVLATRLKMPARVVDANMSPENFNVRTSLVGDNAQGRGSTPLDGMTMFRMRSSRANGYRRGLPQGSAASSIIAEAIMKDLVQALPQGVVAFSWCDDILVLTRTRTDADLSVARIRAAAAANPAGPFGFKRVQIRRVQDGFDFLGMRFRRRVRHPLVKPTDQRRIEFLREVEARCGVLYITGKGIERDRAFVRSWCATCFGWEDAPVFCELLLAKLEWALSRHLHRRQLAARRREVQPVAPATNSTGRRRQRADS